MDEGVKAQIDSCEELLSAIEGVASQQSFIAKLMAVLEESRALVRQGFLLKGTTCYLILIILLFTDLI